MHTQFADCCSFDKKLKDQSGAQHSEVLLFYIKAPNGKLTILGDFFNLHIQNQKGRHKVFFSEPTALFMKFPTRDFIREEQKN